MMDEGKWTLRSKIIWWKRNATPSSVKDRFTPDWEYLLFFVKSPDNYYFRTQYEPHNPKYDSRYKSPFGGSKNKSGQGAFDYTRTRFLKRNPLGRIKRCVWNIPSESYKDAHFAVYPTELITTPIVATSPDNGIVLDPFMGSGTTALVALKNGKKFVGIELNQEYVDLAYKRLEPLLLQKTQLWSCMHAGRHRS
jgi:site-specific DNA-methyltransferase (adenine-specific)